jgi:short-subunit dehydrogenase
MRIVITGASSGIGHELAKIYKARGDKLFLVARRIELLDEFLGENIFGADLSKLDEAIRTGEAIAKWNPDLIIINAGISLGHSQDKLTNLNDFENLFITNFSSIHPTLYPTLLKWINYFNNNLSSITNLHSGSGTEKIDKRIVFISSLASLITLPSSIAYSTSKRAMNSYAEGLRFFLKPYGVKIITILPGFIETPLTHKNKFNMPFILPLEKGVEEIYDAIEANKVFYPFPYIFYILIKILNLLPNFLRDWFISKSVVGVQ